MNHIVINEDNIKALKEYPDNYFDSVITDPPYGLGKEPNPEEVMRGWIEKGYHEVGGSGFMGKEWDSFIPQPIFWKEVFRVLKHGGHVVSFFGTRTYDWGVMAMRFAGFEVRDCIQWIYGSGFPKSLSISKSIDKQNKNKWENISKSIDNINKSRILDIWKEKSSNATIVDVILKKNPIEIGTPTQKKDSVQENVVLRINQEKEIANVIIAELSSQEVLLYVEENQHIAQKSVEANIEQLQNHAKYVVKYLQDQNHLLTSIFTAESSVKDWQKESISQIIKVEEVLKIWHGNQKSLKEEDIYVLCVELINDLKHTILNQSKTFLNYGIKQKMECVSAINVIITEYMVVNLISNMVDILKSKAIDKIEGAKREVIGDKVSIDGRLLSSRVPNAINKYQGGFNTYSDLIYNTKITAPSTEQAKLWDGWGSALKPANEPIVLARKPLEKGLSIAENVLKWGTGGLNIDGARIGIEERIYKGSGKSNQRYSDGRAGLTDGRGQDIEFNARGRFPANLILSHHPECECKGLKKVKPSNGSGKASENGGGFSKGMFGDGTSDNIGGGFTDENGEETIEDWDCHEDCPIKIMDEQSLSMGMHSAGNHRKKNVLSEYQNSSYHAPSERQMNRFGDTGGASRFFYCAKASKSERNKGLEGFEEKLPNTNDFTNLPSSRSNSINTSSGKERVVLPNQNFHPTVKPVKLMQYLVRLITPPNGKVLDPFCGSGTTGIACKLEGFEFIGLEQDAEYSKIAQSRIDNYEEEIEEIVYVTNKEGEKVQITQTSLF